MPMFEVFSSDSQIAEIVLRFMDHSLPRSSWGHAAHFATTLWLLSNRPRADVERDLPGLIRTYNQATGLPNSDLKGYHETITQASLRAAVWFLSNSPPRPLFATCNALMRSPLGHPQWLLKYWSPSRLFSIEARQQWVDPDLDRFPYP
jgi:hypothetical protein